MSKFIYWVPRILGILFVLFLGMFSLDVFDPSNNYSLTETIVAFFIHNIPSLILLIVLIVSWKYEMVGGIGFILGGIIYIAFVLTAIISTGFEWYYLAWILEISGIFFFVGILFLIGWKRKTKFKSRIK